MAQSLSDFKKSVLETWPNNVANKTGQISVSKFDKHNVDLPITKIDDEFYKAVQERKCLVNLHNAFIDFYGAIVTYESHATHLENTCKKDFEDISETDNPKKIKHFIENDDRLSKAAAIKSSADAARKALPNLIKKGEFSFTYDKVLTNHSDPFVLRLLGDVLKGFAAIFSHLAALTLVGVVVTREFWWQANAKKAADGHFFSSGDTTSVALAEKVKDALIKVEAAIELVNELIVQQDASVTTAPTPQ